MACMEDIRRAYKELNNEKSLAKNQEHMKYAIVNKRMKALGAGTLHIRSSHAENYNQKSWFLGRMPRNYLT